MPTYEYECTSCGHTFETIQSIRDKALSRCPQCSKGSLRRLINGGMGVIFKGSGFYTTDYKRSSTLTGTNGSSGGKEKAADKPKESSTEKTSSG